MAALSLVGRVLSQSFLKSKAPSLSASVRWLNLHEYQSKKLMADHDIDVQRFQMAETTAQAREISEGFKVREYVIKAQVLAGGRGKGVFSNGFKGGVHLTKKPEDVPKIVKCMLGHRLVTKQTGADGVLVTQVMVAEALDIDRETYFAIVLNREYGGPVMVGSPQGGVDIEEVAAKTPEAIFTVPIDVKVGLLKEQVEEMATNMGFTGDFHKKAVHQIKQLYELFCRVDATQVEINPLGETPEGRVVCFDAKINFDDNAEYRQKEIFAQADTNNTDPREVEAHRHDLNYIGLDGNIGCLVNGAGLAMATMDIVKHHGGMPANFLDVGGAVTEEQVKHAFRILSSDKQVKAILVNVFGGIVNCATIANGITKAAQEINLQVPLVVRLEGTNVNEAKRIIRDSGLDILSADDLEDAAIKAVAAL